MPRKHARRRRWPWKSLTLLVPVCAFALVVGAWAIDTAALGSDVVRNVSIGGKAVGRADRSTVTTTVEQLAAEFAATAVAITTPEGSYTSTAGELGLAIDQEATVDAVLDAGRNGAMPLRPISWLRSFVSEWEVEPRYQVDRVRLGIAVATLEGDRRTAPIEPAFLAGPAGIELVPGVAGRGIEVDPLADALLLAAGVDGEPIEVGANVGVIPPRFGDDAARPLVDTANEATAAGLTVNANGVEPRSIAPEVVRTWLRLDTSGVEPAVAIDSEVALATIQLLFGDVTRAPVEARFDVVDGAPVLIPSSDGLTCCEPVAADQVLAAVTTGPPTVDLTLTVTPPVFTTEAAQALGIVEEVGQPTAFGPTTNHAAGEPRVTNIHRIADIIRGVVIGPGETFSVNTFVGERTVENGFVDAPVIYQGEFTTDIGGGVSQFATTFFNAALYAGLDFGEYQSHSVLISRYPAGHEATISYPHPDLQIRNTTPYGVLVWPTYTSSSITVHLYSTHYVDVSIGNPTTSPAGNCTAWSTPRTRTYVDGRVELDTIAALYRPGEGIDC
jgi:vancomycin resistance protein YoaR